MANPTNKYVTDRGLQQPDFTDLTGTATAAQLPSSGVTPGSYTTADITVNAEGQVTAAANGSAGSSVAVDSIDGSVAVTSISTLKFSNSIQPDTVVQTAPAFVQSASSTVSSSATKTQAFTSNITAGNLIVICANWNSSSITLAPTDTLGNLYFAATAKAVNGSESAQIWYAYSESGGANTVTFTFSGAVSGAVYVHEYSGLNTPFALDVNHSNTGSASTSFNSGTFTTNYAKELIFGFAYCSGGSGAAGSGFNSRETSGGNITEDKFVSTAGSNSTTFTAASSTYIALMATFYGISTGAGTGTARIYIPVAYPLDIPPAQPSPWDDEFDKPALDAKWVSGFFNGGTFSWDIDTSLRSCFAVRTAARTTSNGSQITLEQAAVLPEVFSATCKFFTGNPTSNTLGFGIGFSDTNTGDVNSMACSYVFSTSFVGSLSKFVSGVQTANYTTAAVSPTPGLMYMHVQRWTDGLWYMWHSTDGVSWIKDINGSNPTTTFFPAINFVQVFFSPQNVSGATPAYRQGCDWIRYNFLWLEP